MLYNKIKTIYPSLTDADFDSRTGTITLQDNSDGKGPFIAKWEHPTLTRPTQTQLDEVTE
jgi:hypothetical protein